MRIEKLQGKENVHNGQHLEKVVLGKVLVGVVGVQLRVRVSYELYPSRREMNVQSRSY